MRVHGLCALVIGLVRPTQALLPVISRRAIIASAAGVSGALIGNAAPATAGGSATAAVIAQASARATTAADPLKQLRDARAQLAATARQLEATRSAAEWGALRDALAQPTATVRAVASKQDPARAEYLSAILEVESFAYEQQRKNYRDTYKGGYVEFQQRLDIDVSAPTAALMRAQAALEAIGSR